MITIQNVKYMSDFEAKNAIIEIGKRMYMKGFVAANDGNISCKVGPSTIWTTPTGVSKGYMTSDMLVKMDFNGKILMGTRKPSSEVKMHLRVYNENPDVMAVTHAHPMVATSFAIAGISLDRAVLPEAVVQLGGVHIVVFDFHRRVQRLKIIDQRLHQLQVGGGVLFILKPGGGAFTTFPSFIGILGGLGAGFAYTFVRAASQHKVPGPVIVLFFSVFSCAACIPFCIADFKCFSSLQLFYMLCVGLSATGGQFAITAAYSHSPAREISVYDYTQILFAALFGILFFGEIPDRYSLLGYAIIILASVTIFVIQKKAQEKEKPV